MKVLLFALLLLLTACAGALLPRRTNAPTTLSVNDLRLADHTFSQFVAEVGLPEALRHYVARPDPLRGADSLATPLPQSAGGPTVGPAPSGAALATGRVVRQLQRADVAGQRGTTSGRWSLRTTTPAGRDSVLTGGHYVTSWQCQPERPSGALRWRIVANRHVVDAP